MKKNCKRGFTLAELSVVLAVIAIVSTVVISFTAMVTQRSRISKAQLDALHDIELIEALVEAHIESGKYEPKTDDENLGTVYMSEEDGVKKVNVGDSKIAVETVISVDVTPYPDENADDILYICTIKYHIPYEKENNTHTYTFCVNPYVGETVN